jgi:putative ABC transport system substrate-binding protein
LRRRDFIRGIAGSAAAWPLAASAQQTSKLPTIGLLGTDASFWSPWTAAFTQRLHELGWTEGNNVAIEYRWDDGRSERDAEVAAEFVQNKVDVVVASGNGAAALKRATSVIPIVFAMDNDPVGSGLVASLARPGGNVTGLALQSPELAGKRLELLRDVVPHLRRIAIMANIGYRQAVLEMEDLEAAARKLGIEVTRLEIRRVEDIAPAFESLKAQADALYVVSEALVGANRALVIKHAFSAQLPTMFNQRGFVEAGGLMSYGPSFQDQFRRTAELVDKILRGTKPADLPVEQPIKFDLVISLKTAKAIGLTISPTLLTRADEVIE